MPWSFPKVLFFDGRLPLGVAVAHALMLIVVLAQPVASLAWLGGVHATIEQAILHDEAVEHGHYYHHGVPQHHEHRASGGAGKPDTRFSPPAPGPVFTSAAAFAGPFQDLLQASLTVPPDALSPNILSRCASLAEVVICQHSPPVPHRPPIFS